MSVRDYPAAIESEFFAGLSEAPVTLYDGPGAISEDGVDYDVHVEVVMLGRPRNRLTFRATGDSLSWSEFPARCHLRLGPTSALLTANVNLTNIGLRAGSIQDLVVFPDESAVREVRFGVPNFTEFFGEIARYASGAARRGRVCLVSDVWTVTLDVVRNDVMSRLEQEGGVATTHVARLERTDGGEFFACDVVEVLRALEIYLAFVAGATIGITIAHGIDEHGSQAWELWRPAKMHPFQNRRNWSDSMHVETAELGFSEFMRHWNDSQWRRTLSNAIQWYVDANRQVGYLEGSIILAQSVLELLACSCLPDQTGFGSESQIERAHAYQRVRWLLQWLNLSPEIPPQLIQLLDWQTREGFLDGPATLIRMRNDLIHPGRDNVERLDRVTDGVYFQAWTYGLWIAELALLKKLGYRGHYANRITQSWAGHVELVPWA